MERSAAEQGYRNVLESPEVGLASTIIKFKELLAISKFANLTVRFISIISPTIPLVEARREGMSERLSQKLKV